MSDWQIKQHAKRDALGLSEREDRLPTIFLPLAVATCWFCTEYPVEKCWVGLEIGYGMLSFGLMQVLSIGFNYLIDSHGRLAVDCFIVVTILLSIIAFAWTFFVSHWVETKGPAKPLASSAR